MVFAAIVRWSEGSHLAHARVLLDSMLSLARFACVGQVAAKNAACGIASRRTAAINSVRPPFHHRTQSRSLKFCASRWKPGDGTDDEVPNQPTEVLIDAMGTASKLRGRNSKGKVTTVMGDGASLGGNLSWEELDEKVNEYPMDRKFQAIGEGDDAFVQRIVGMIEEALGRPVDNPDTNVTSRPSSKGKYVSANVTVRLENGNEVIAVYEKLKACDDVKWYL